MKKHLNSQAKGPKLDSTLERYLYHRRSNFLINVKLNIDILSDIQLFIQNRISQVKRQSLIIN